MLKKLTRKISDLPALDEDEREDAWYRGRDRAWAALIELFDARQRQENLTYEGLGRRIGRSRSQVQRWLSASCNMSLRSLGLLAEGLDADLDIRLNPREDGPRGANYCHPREAAKVRILVKVAAPAESARKPTFYGDTIVGISRPSIKTLTISPSLEAASA